MFSHILRAEGADQLDIKPGGDGGGGEGDCCGAEEGHSQIRWQHTVCTWY